MLKFYNFKHSGNIGDVIYSLPFIRGHKTPKHLLPKLFLQPEVPAQYYQGAKHPCGRYRMTTEMAEFLLPLLERNGIHASVWKGEPVDLDLDRFRDIPRIDYTRGNIARWYFWAFGGTANLSLPWLTVEPDFTFEQKIVVNRTSRYRNPAIDYSCLRARKQVVFLGLQDEYKEFLNDVPEASHVEATDALHAARVIAGARFFIGNQSFCFSLAEAMKVPRILEVCPFAQNVHPCGYDGPAWDCPNQNVFALAIEEAIQCTQ